MHITKRAAHKHSTVRMVIQRLNAQRGLYEMENTYGSDLAAEMQAVTKRKNSKELYRLHEAGFWFKNGLSNTSLIKR